MADEFIGTQVDQLAVFGGFEDAYLDAPQLAAGQVDQGFVGELNARLRAGVADSGGEPLVLPAGCLVRASGWAAGR